MSDKDLPAFPVAYGGGRIEGMTLRDYFAAKAMQATIERNGISPANQSLEFCAFKAYAMADAMMEAHK